MKRMNCFVVRYCSWSHTSTRPGVGNVEMSGSKYDLNPISIESTSFRVDACAVRETCSLLTNRQAEKEKSELKQSGISPEDTPLDNAIKNIINRIRECEEEQENQDNENIQKNKKERKATEDRLTAVESLAESKAQKRTSLIDDDESPKNSTTVRTNDGHNAAIITKQTVNTCI